MFAMIYPIMVQISFEEIKKAVLSPKPIALTLFANWVIKPFTMALFAWLFLSVVFGVTYIAGRMMHLSYEDASPAAIIAGSNHFEVAIAVATTLFGVTSGAALATVVGVLTEVPFMLILVQLCKATKGTFHKQPLEGKTVKPP
ncbi:unnamed protein product [marine sediment metagenome]|uniref:Arsenical-resistance protein n=1 Tax=marine sediment metagenome TaxID=412755 RepID=X1QW42_9ZZZZ